MTKYKIGILNTKSKYYIRRIITTFLIASPCYIWSQTLVLLGFVLIAKFSPGTISDIDIEVGAAWFTLSVWVTMFVIGWYSSKLLIVKPKELQKITNEIQDR